MKTQKNIAIAIFISSSILSFTTPSSAWDPIKNTPLDPGTWGGAASDVRDAVVGTVAGDTESEVEVVVMSKVFTISNKSEETLNVCIGYRNTGEDTNSKPSWEAEGWKIIKPGEKKDVYEGLHKKIYIRVEKKSGEISKPSSSTKNAEFCISDDKFTSNEFDVEGNYKFKLNGEHGDSCQDVGGRMERFYLMVPNNNTFTVR